MASSSVIHSVSSGATVDRRQLAWKSSSLLQQQQGNKLIIKHLHYSRAWRGLSNNIITRGRLSSSSSTGPLFQNPNPVDGAPFCQNLKADQGSRSSRVITHAGRSKAKNEKPASRRKPQRFGRGLMRPGNAERKKKTPEPYTRHPDDYYKFGPYGPYAYKAAVAGTLKPVTTLTRDHVFMWSTVKDLKEQEQLDVHNACVSYDNRVRRFDDTVGLQFFYVFVRLPFKFGREPPWKQWTLVSEITIESGDNLDKYKLLSRVNQVTKNRITQHTGWFRPDLVYVKKPGYQVRFEPEMEFLRELRKLLLESAGEAHEKDSYYGEFCRILELDVDASHEDVTSKYEESPEEIQCACLEHLLSKHPVQLLHPFPYPNRRAWVRGQFLGENDMENKNNTSMPAEPVTDMADEEEELTAENYDEGFSESDEEEDNETEAEEWDDAELESRMNKGFSELDKEGSMDLDVFDDADHVGNAMDSEDDEFAGKDDDRVAGDQKVSTEYASPREPLLKAAVRPYTYVNFIREMVMLRHMLLQRKKNVQQVQGGWG